MAPMTVLPATWAQRLIEAVVSAVSKRSLFVSIAIVDASGYLIALLRMDGAGLLTPQIAEAKAFTAAAWRQPTVTAAERARIAPETFQAFINIGRTKLVPGLGDLSLRANGTLAGAIGVSGATADGDDELSSIGTQLFDAMASTKYEPSTDNKRS